MIDPAILKQLGWSDELVAAVTREAEPLRQTAEAIGRARIPQQRNIAVGGASFLADAVVSHSAQEFRVVDSQPD